MFRNAQEPIDLSKIYTGKPRQYRSDCQMGQFKINASQLVGKSLKMEILGYRTFEDEIFGYEYQQWLEVLFIDPKNIVSTILFKTESLDNFQNYLLELSGEGQAIGSVITIAKMAARSSKASGNSYYACEFEAAEQKPERYQEILSFVSGFDLAKIGSSVEDRALPAAE